jgi:cell division protein ZapA (FtsZ GTPase activity inhibitor)
MTVKREGEQNILGCTIRFNSNDESGEKAQKAFELLENQINTLRAEKPALRDLDIAVLAALNLSLDKIEMESEYKDSVLSLKKELQDVIEFVGSQSPAV